MKKLFIILGICIILTSCAPSSVYYQMYKTKPKTEDIKVEENAIVYENEDCVILYDFWGKYGDFGFLLYNKGDDNIYLHLDQCFYIVNGFAYDYYQNRVYSTNSTTVSSSTQSVNYGSLNSSTTATSTAYAYSLGSNINASAYGSSNTYKNGYISGISNSVVSSSSNSVSTAEKRIICIPPKTQKYISEFNIKTQMFRSCDLLLKPGKKDNKTIEFSEEDTPYVFGNLLSYSIGNSEDLVKIRNDFYVSSISNYPMEDIKKTVNQTDCGKRIEGLMKSVFKISGPDMFYIKYGYDYNSSRKH